MPRPLELQRDAAVAVLVVALGRPAMVLSVPSNQTTIVLAMDVSGSMRASDVNPTRIAAAETAAVPAPPVDAAR